MAMKNLPPPPVPHNRRRRYINAYDNMMRRKEMSELEQDLRDIVETGLAHGDRIETIQFMINKRVAAEKAIKAALPQKKQDKKATTFIMGLITGALVSTYILSIFLV